MVAGVRRVCDKDVIRWNSCSVEVFVLVIYVGKAEGSQVPLNCSGAVVWVVDLQEILGFVQPLGKPFENEYDVSVGNSWCFTVVGSIVFYR